MKRFGTLGAIAIFIVLIGVTALACGPETVRMGTEGAYKPYNFTNDAGDLDGFEIELGDELCRRAQLKCTWVTNEWDSIIPNLLADNYDTIMAGMSITAEREKQVDFTEAYFPPTTSVYVALDGAGDEVINGKVAVQVNTIQAHYLSDYGAMVLEFDLAEEPVTAVLNGEADAILADRTFLKEFVDKSEGRLVYIGPEVKVDSGVGIGVRKTDVELKGKLDTAISAMKDDGSLNALIIKWFGADADTF
jgi:polar amino acid transport system substrate-binding protein